MRQASAKDLKLVIELKVAQVSRSRSLAFGRCPESGLQSGLGFRVSPGARHVQGLAQRLYRLLMTSQDERLQFASPLLSHQGKL